MVAKLQVLHDLRRMLVYVYSIQFPSDERFGLQSQLRRAMVSALLNIREGNAFNNDNRKRFFLIARASLEEVEECIIIAKSLRYIQNTDEFYSLFWLCYNKLNKLMMSSHQYAQHAQSVHHVHLEDKP